MFEENFNCVKHDKHPVLLQLLKHEQGNETSKSGIYILSVNEKLPVLKFRYFRKIYNTARRLLLQSFSGQRRTGLEKNTSSTSPGTKVHVIHVLVLFFAVFGTLIA